MKQIRDIKKAIDVQLNVSYESSSGFRDDLSKITAASPAKGEYIILKSAWLDSPLGPMLVISDETGLYLLEFLERRGLEKEIERFKMKLKAVDVLRNKIFIETNESC